MQSQPPHSTLSQLRATLLLPDQAVRVVAMRRLLAMAKADVAIRPELLPMFESAAATDNDCWTAMYAAQGIECVQGSDGAQVTWRDLLSRPDPNFVSTTASALTDARYVPDLIAVLQQRTEPAVQIAALRSLGRMKNSAAFEPMFAALADHKLRPHAVEALADLADPRAVTYLEPLLIDTAEAWPEDNHGPMLRVCDLARSAIQRLTAVTRVAPPVIPPAPLVRSASRSNFDRLTILPLIGAILVIPWFGVIMFWELFTTGKLSPAPGLVHRQDMLSMMPAIAGLLVGIMLTRRKMKSTGGIVMLIVGIIACLSIIVPFAYEMTH